MEASRSSGGVSRQLGMAQVLVDRFPADPVVTGQNDFWNTGTGALDHLGGTFR